MKTKTLNSILKLASRISNPSSLTPLYRAVEIGPDAIRCCSEFGNIHLLLETNTGLKGTILLDCSAILAVTQSLPADSEITFSEEVNKVTWSSGNAKGHFNHIQTDHKVLMITHDTFPWIPPQDLGNALMLAASACQAAAVTIGLYGITIEPDGDRLRFLSSNSISLAATSVEKGTYPAGKVTIRPPVPGIIAALIGACPNTSLDIVNDGIFIEGDWLRAHLPLSPNHLDHDLKKLADEYIKSDERAAINGDEVKKFIARAKSLAEKKTSLTVALKVENGNLVLTHEGIGSSTEEYFLAEGLPPTTNYQPVVLPADLLMLPLSYVQYIILDYIKDQKLVFHGEAPDFTYVLGGNTAS